MSIDFEIDRLRARCIGCGLCTKVCPSFKHGGLNPMEVMMGGDGDLANNKGHREGLFLYAVTITILVALFWDHWTAATIGVVAMTFGDGMGSVVGRRFGRHRFLGGKSVEGSLGVFAATAIMAAVIMFFYGWLTASGYYPTGDSVAIVPVWAVAVIAGAVATVLEALCPGQYDNIVTPLVVACAMVLLGL